MSDTFYETEGDFYALTSHWGGVGKGRCIQFTAGREYISIPVKAACDMARALLQREQPETLAAPRVEITELQGQPIDDWIDLARLVYKLTATDNPKDGRVQLEKRWIARSLPGPAPRVVEVTADDLEDYEFARGKDIDENTAWWNARLRARAGEAANKNTDRTATATGRGERRPVCLACNGQGYVADWDDQGLTKPSYACTLCDGTGRAAPILSAPSLPVAESFQERELAYVYKDELAELRARPVAAVPESFRRALDEAYTYIASPTRAERIKGDLWESTQRRTAKEYNQLTELLRAAKRDLAALDAGSHVMVEKIELERLRKIERDQIDEAQRFNAGYEKARRGVSYSDIEDEFEQMGWGWFHTPDAMSRATAAEARATKECEIANDWQSTADARGAELEAALRVVGSQEIEHRTIAKALADEIEKRDAALAQVAELTRERQNDAAGYERVWNEAARHLMPAENEGIIAAACRVVRERDALAVWKCADCDARFANTVSPIDREGVRRCSKCVEVEALGSALGAARAEVARLEAERGTMDVEACATELYRAQHCTHAGVAAILRKHFRAAPAPGVTVPTRETVRAELVSEVGECCNGADPLCHARCLVQVALDRRHGLASSAPAAQKKVDREALAKALEKQRGYARPGYYLEIVGIVIDALRAQGFDIGTQ